MLFMVILLHYVTNVMYHMVIVKLCNMLHITNILYIVIVTLYNMLYIYRTIVTL